ncbi:l-threonine aldolase-related [Holotrichia oblita]|uniref:L-threonine aldolase-related n=1 Tax=Holotrichia oblita TaxID=644536 RepID=A0ACB9SMK7_HOLOL|nr:l-threonine aldolase-related [Holotrichia oblita]
MPYDHITNGFSNGYTNGNSELHVVDLRSDTISKPTQAMREAMAIAPVGDDVYGEDPTVNLLIQKSCQLFGKEDGILVPSGTMANMIARGPAQLAGVQQALVRNKNDGTFCLDEMCSRIRIDPDCHEPYTALIVVENTHNMCGGKVLPLEWLDKLGNIAKSHGIAVHMDGARIMNAAVASKVELSRIVRDMDSVCFCLSKSLGAPIGSVLLGTKAFIERAKRVRKVLGGGMRQAGIMAAAGIVALDSMMDQLRIDHEHLRQIAEAIHNMNSKIFKVDLQADTNILMIYLDNRKVTADKFLQRLYDVYPNDPIKVRIRASTRDNSCIRFVFYWEITDEDVQMAIKKLEYVIREFETKTSV